MKKIVLFILASFYAINMYALGTETSGGGGAAVCRDQYKNITSAYLLDLYEGKYRFNLNIPQTAQNPDDQIIKAISKIQDPVIKQLIKQTIADIINRASFLPNGVSLSPSTDLGKDYGAVVPDGCVIEPIGFYESSGVLKISKSIYKALSETDKAAFFVHEAIYKLARDMVYQQDSALSRKLVATMFSTQTIEVEKALEGLFKESWNYWNYHQLSSIKLYNFLDTVDLSVKLDSSKFKEVDSISIECASSQNTYQEVKNNNVADFKLDIGNCSSINLHIPAQIEQNNAGNETLGKIKVSDQNNNLIYDENISHSDVNVRNMAPTYFVPILYLYKVIPKVPKI